MRSLQNIVITLIVIILASSAYGDERYSCEKWKREHPQIKGTSLTKKLYPDEDGIPFLLSFQKEKIEILDRLETRQILKYSGRINYNTSIYQSLIGSDGYSAYYYLENLNNGDVIRLQRITQILPRVYYTHCYK